MVTFSDVFPGAKVQVFVNGVPAPLTNGNALYLPGKVEVVARQVSPAGITSDDASLSLAALIPVEQIKLTQSQVTTDSEESGEGEVVNAIDGDTDTYWHSAWSKNETDFPHWIDIRLSAIESIRKLRFLQRQNQENGRIPRMIIEAKVADEWVIIREVTLPNSTDWIDVELDNPIVTRELRIKPLREVGGNKWASLAELEIYRDFKPKREIP
jgi:hypothetical protein